ncbi:MAG: hypothetical protein P8Y73_07460 [Desulfuromonadales bacterium]
MSPIVRASCYGFGVLTRPGSQGVAEGIRLALITALPDDPRQAW